MVVSTAISEARNKNQIFKMKSKASKAERRSKPKIKGCYIKHRKNTWLYFLELQKINKGSGIQWFIYTV